MNKNNCVKLYNDEKKQVWKSCDGKCIKLSTKCNGKCDLGFQYEKDKKCVDITAMGNVSKRERNVMENVNRINVKLKVVLVRTSSLHMAIS